MFRGGRRLPWRPRARGGEAQVPQQVLFAEVVPPRAGREESFSKIY